MAGPGGGANGGGGFGGSGRGGGFGGGFGGGGHRGPHHHHYGPRGFFFGPRMPFFLWGWHRPYYFGYGGFPGGWFSLLFMPILIIALSILLIIPLVISTIASVAAGGNVVYDAAVMEEYAYERYVSAFDGSEDGIMIVFLTNEDNTAYSYIGWVGDNIASSINMKFGNQYTALGQAMNQSINYSYHANSLTSNLSMVIEIMTEEVTALRLDSSFRGPTTATNAESKLYNYTELSITDSIVNSTLAEFTAATEIPIAITVDTEEAVFGRTIPVAGIVLIIILAAVGGYMIYIIIRNVRAKRRYKGGDNNGPHGGYGGYNDGGYGGYNNRYNNGYNNGYNNNGYDDRYYN